jgi:hypothetical protein
MNGKQFVLFVQLAAKKKSKPEFSSYAVAVSAA